MTPQLSAPIMINDHVATYNELKLQTITDLNNKAIECCDEEAEFYLHECLDQCNIDLSSSVPQHNSLTELNSSSSNHGGYDEGMNKFLEPLSISPGLDFCAAIATILYNQGLLCLRQNRYREAANYFPCALQKLQSSNYCSVNDNNGCVNMFQILHNVGLVHYRSTRYEDALAAYTQAFQILRHSKNTINDPRCMQDVASTLNCLGVIYFQMKGASAKAIEVFNQSLGIRRDIIGKDQDDEDIACTMNNLGCVYSQNGDQVKALGLYIETLSMRVRLFGRKHKDVAATSLNVGQAHHRLGNLAKALDHYEMFISIGTEVLGELHSDLTTGLKGIAQIWFEKKNFDKAIESYQKAISVERDGKEICKISDKIASAFCEKGDFDGAIRTYKETLDLQSEVHGFCSLKVVDTLKRMSHVRKLCGEFDGCIRLLRTAVDIECKVLGKFHPNVSSSLSSIALVYYETRNFKDALKVYQDVIHIQRRVFGRNHAHPAGTLRSIGTLLLHTKNYEMALRAFNESLKVYRALDNADDIAVVLSNIASINWHLGDYERCIMHYSETLSTLQRSLGCERHMKLIPTLKRLGTICGQRGMLYESIHYLTEAVEILQINAISDPESSNVAIAEILKEIGGIYSHKGETNKMMLFFSEALRYFSMAGKTDHELSMSNLNYYDISKQYPECSPAA